MPKKITTEIPAPDSFDDLYEWYEDDSPEWIDNLIERGLSWDAGYILDHSPELQTIDSWDLVTISASAADDWSLTFALENGTETTLEFGEDWDMAWDIFNTLDYMDDVETERGEIEY